MSDMLHDLEDLERDNALLKQVHRLVPRGWDKATSDSPCAPRKKMMSIRLDGDLLDWFRAQGGGYQIRINKILRAYMNSVISKVVEEKKDRDWEDKPI